MQLFILFRSNYIAGMLQQLIKDCKKGKSKAQLKLYIDYAPMLRGLCRRYMQNPEEAEDLLQDGFFKIFSNIKSFKGEGSFEGWMKRIIINTAIKELEKKGHIIRNNDIERLSIIDETDDTDNDIVFKILDDGLLSQQEIIDAVNSLQEDYRIVFNLFIFENYKHKEIAEMLNIKESTSKSKVLRARKMLQGNLLEIIKEKEKKAFISKNKSFISNNKNN